MNQYDFRYNISYFFWIPPESNREASTACLVMQANNLTVCLLKGPWLEQSDTPSVVRLTCKDVHLQMSRDPEIEDVKLKRAPPKVCLEQTETD